MAVHHKQLNKSIMNDLLRPDWERKYARGLFDAYAYVVQMIEHNDTIGIADYKKVFKMKEKFPKIWK